MRKNLLRNRIEIVVAQHVKSFAHLSPPQCTRQFIVQHLIQAQSTIGLIKQRQPRSF